ncbi:hypothetical protein LCGC14_2922750 [marine sediment metagenome]|uniref:Uncharacterized protein n=1 Tax=marine sediment metagenome TaxID=412755 RepID=A0A0F8ZVY7_9ZZZZ
MTQPNPKLYRVWMQRPGREAIFLGNARTGHRASIMCSHKWNRNKDAEFWYICPDREDNNGTQI